MLYELEWNTPHTAPGGMTVKQWVADIKAWEEKGWLADPINDKVTAAHEIRVRRTRYAFCHLLCWRERCHRAGRCKTRLPLAIREFQPEWGVVLRRRAAISFTFNGKPDPEKMALMEKFFDMVEAERPNFFKLGERLAAAASLASGKRKR